MTALIGSGGDRIEIGPERSGRSGILVPLAGRDGTSISIAGSVATYADLPTGLGVRDRGALYIVETGESSLGYVWSGTAWPSEGAGIEIRGPKGDDGDDGRGYTGVTIAGNALRFAATDATVDEVTVPALEAAATAAATATTKAGDAATSADTAAGHAQDAEESAQAAAQSAHDAADVVATGVPNATGSVKGGIVLAGDLAGPWDAPTVPALDGKADLVDGEVPVVQLAAGGTDGQVLAKNGAVAQWIDPPENVSVDGPIAAAAPGYRSAAAGARAGVGQLRILTVGDSSCDGFVGTGVTGGPTSWAGTWPNLLAAKLRTTWGLAPGGTGWVPFGPEGDADQYNWTTATFVDGEWSGVIGDTGIPGSQWMTEDLTLRVALAAGATSADFLTAPVGGGGYATSMIGQSSAVWEWGQDGTEPVLVDTLTNPGSHVDVTSGGGGFQALGVVEHVGDETTGVVSYNLGVAGVSAQQYAIYAATDPFGAFVAEVAPQLALVCLGANDFGTRTTAQLLADLAAIRGRIVAQAPGCSVVLVVRSQPDPGWNAYADAIAAGAPGVGLVVVDTRTAVPVGAAGVYVGDGVHYTAAGNVAMAEAVAEALRIGTLTVETATISDMTAVGRAVATAVDEATALAVLGAEAAAQKGVANGYAPLDDTGRVPAVNLPAYVDDVREYANLAAFPAVGESSILYLALNTNLIYRWSGSGYAEVSQSLALGITGSTACAGNDARLSDTRTPTTGTVPYDTTLPGASELTTRAIGYNDCSLGIKLQRAVTLTKVTYRCLTADGSGNLVVELRKNGVAVSGTSATIAAANQVAGGSVTGSWAFADGDILTVYVTAVGTTPGRGLVADVKGLA